MKCNENRIGRWAYGNNISTYNYLIIWLYLKLGADANLSAKQAKLTTPYDRRKNMVTIGAMAFNLPMKRVHYRGGGASY